jgi:hypothetical protein
MVRCSMSLPTCAALLALLVAATPATAQDLSGHWRGHWEDCRSGHRGPLQACFRKCDEQHYQVVFTGRFFGVVPFRFTTTLNVVGHDGDRVVLAGQSRVGLSGTFRYDAVATDADFNATFSSRRYEGRFILSR